MEKSTEFQPGDKVRDRRDRSRLGEIMEPPTRLGGRTVFKVRWQDGTIGRLPASQLVPASGGASLEELLAEEAFEGKEEFVRNFTHRKLRTPVDDTLYSLKASRTKILPHQFKPLLRFLDSLHRRYLVADEVGLGKTIEAGIILSELRARRSLGGVLIACPNHLRDKWRSELYNRFDESFEIIQTRRGVIQLIDDLERDGSENRRVIVGHKTLQSRRVLERVEEGAPRFDLVVVDEAHVMRNPATLIRRIIAEIADASEQLLLLTATPIQTREENLLSLLRLLDQGTFRSLDQFQERLQTNRFLVRAEALLRRAGPEPMEIRGAAAEARETLSELPDHSRLIFGLDEDGAVETSLKALAELESTPSHSALAEVARSIGEMNLLSPFITRTRKSDVQLSCSRRVESVSPRGGLSDAERLFYDAVVEWCRAAIRERYGQQSVLFLSREIERRLASSLPAFARRLREGRVGRDGILRDPPPNVLRLAAAVPVLDSKASRLLELLRELEERSPDEKVLVFASFRGTLSHLSHILRGSGIDFELIHGDIEMDPINPDRDARGQAVRRFLSDPACRVLLSSNVGGEGLDLQRASIVVNYDMPWNPAVVEQRIGRVDRFGQEREVVKILNFLLPGTVEETIFGRLEERLRMFESTIGDFGRILGRVVEDLSRQFLQDGLTLDQLDQRARDEAWRLQNRLGNLRELLDREGEFVAYDEDFTQQLNDLDAKGLTIRPSDLVAVCDGVLRSHFKRSWLRPAYPEHGGSDAIPGVYDLHIDFNLHQHLRGRIPEEKSGALQRFLARFPPDESRRVTFDGELAEADPTLRLITARHPLIRALVEVNASGDEFHPLSALELGSSDLADGDFLLVLVEGEVKLGPEERRYLVPVAVPARNPEGRKEGRRLIRKLLDDGRAIKPRRSPGGEALLSLFREGIELGDDLVFGTVERIVSREAARVRPRVVEVQERYHRRIERNRERIWGESQKREPDSKRLAGLEKYAKDLVRERDQKLAALNQTPEPQTNARPVGAVWVEVA